MQISNRRIVLFSDMDGTFLNHDKTISERNMQAISDLREDGGMFILATGRILQASRHYFEPLSLDCPCILCNGAMVYDCGTKQVKWSLSLDRDIAFDHIGRILTRFPFAAAEVCMPDGICVVNINDVERMHWKLAGFSPLPTVVGSLDDVPEGEISKILYSVPEDRLSEVQQFCSGLPDREAGEYVVSARTFIEMLPHGCSKGSAMKKLIEIYGLDDCFTAAMGDYDNDIEMLGYADFAACPSNARENVKQVCDLVTDTDCEGGSVADVIYHLLEKKKS
ncbi:MAG: HAD family phosphatase [Oscillospiraceae bacterium]|nr:HAD family phosphatase [Oscillospiraceae bacterium]